MLPRSASFGDVVDAVAIHVGRVGDEVLLHPVALCGQRLDVLGQRGRTGLTLHHRDRQPRFRAVQIVPHIEYEVVVGRGRDHDGNGLHLYRHRRRVIATPRTRLRVALPPCRGREQRRQHYDSNRREDGGQGRRQGGEKAKEGPSAPWTGGGKCASTTMIYGCRVHIIRHTDSGFSHGQSFPRSRVPLIWPTYSLTPPNKNYKGAGLASSEPIRAYPNPQSKADWRFLGLLGVGVRLLRGI